MGPLEQAVCRDSHFGPDPVDVANSISALGNMLIENNFSDLGGEAWLARIPDAGHRSVSDVCGLIDDFIPGCGEGIRQTSGEPFS
jgi:hypothetical protein